MRSAESLEEALELMAREPGAWRPFAGGTDLMVLLEAGKLTHAKYLNLWQLEELRRIEVEPESVVLGATVTYSQVLRNETLADEFPLLGRAARETGTIATQNRGTLAGNIANASPAADTPPALLVYDAELELASARGVRRVAYHGFHRGYKKMDLAADEIIRNIRLPRKYRCWKQYYRKVGTRQAQAISKVCFAGAARWQDARLADVRIALGAVAPVPLRCVKTEKVLRGERLSPELVRAAQAELAKEISPIDDFRSTARYRRRVAQNLLAEFLWGSAPANAEQ
jgi:CO/xanthine dehydrogenase FAD-binding subunit